ncbi:MAG: C25 family cysteine peptidase, partial [bacterium]|nr:C25 family cysteine peptidase [bacterium]
MKKVLLTVTFLTLAGQAFSQPSREVARLRWAGPPGSGPGTYQEWLAKHPVKKFEKHRVKSRINPKTKGTGAAVVIESGMYSLVADKIDTLMEFLSQDGHSVYLYTVSGGTPESLKTLLKGLNDSSGLEGAIFIGDLPVAWFEANNEYEYGYAQWPIDLYYMDLDGSWLDTLGGSANGIYDGHSGTMSPEIYIGRLTLTGISNPGTVLENYLDKDISYRRRENSLPPRAMVFVDDDWDSWVNFWAWSVGQLYKDITKYATPDTTV